MDDKPPCLILHLSLTCSCNCNVAKTREPISAKQQANNNNNDRDEEDDDVKLSLSPRSSKRRRIMAVEAIRGEIVPYVQPAENLRSWTIRKVLKKSDVDNSSRLLIGRDHVLAHIAPFFTKTVGEFCRDGGVRVAVFDVDTRTEKVLTMKKWKTDSFVLVNNWKQDFVKSRELMVDEEVGLRWDLDVSRLEFSVLSRRS